MANRLFNLTQDSLARSAAHLPPKRIDLHCHSIASNEADEALLNAINCPESFSSPTEVYAQAKNRGMDFVTITDHDSLNGVLTLCDRENVLTGEELTCYFPEDHCKMHILVWGLTADDHNALQAAAEDIYEVADIMERRNLAHSVAHPVYRQNDRLEKWHLERLILMFKGFETLNGAHSVLHRQAIEPMLDELTEDSIRQLAATHRMAARWPRPHIKSRTGGSDDHGLFNIGRTWTEFPAEATTIVDLLDCLRDGRCWPGGEAGSSLKLAHNFYSVGIRYYGQRLNGGAVPKSLSGILMQSLIGERRNLRRRDLVKIAVKQKARSIGRRLMSPFAKAKQPKGAALLYDLFFKSFRGRIGEHSALTDALRDGRAPLGEHTEVFSFLSALNRDVTGGIADSIEQSLGCGELQGIFDSLSTVAAQQFMLMPYYFAMFHQNRERRVLPRITGRGSGIDIHTMKLGVFTDTFDEINGVARFIQDMSAQARRSERSLVVHTCTNNPRVNLAARKNFLPLFSKPMPCYADQTLSIPPLTEILEWADRQQFDAIHVHTPGPMGLCGWLVAKMLRIPVLATYHTDFPQYMQDLTGDHRLTTATTAYMQWFYGHASTIFTRSKDYRGKLNDLGFGDERIAMILPGVDTDKFSPEKRDLALWSRLGVSQHHKLLYAGRVSVEKNLPFLVETFKKLCQVGSDRGRTDTALIIAGDGPYRAAMQKALNGLPAYFLGFQNDEQLAALYASSDLFVFPSKTDTLGQVVVEAQAAGCPVLVSDQGGPKELMDDQITGHVLPAESTDVWREAIESLLNDTPRRLRMSRTAPNRRARFSLEQMFEAFWAEHLKAATLEPDAPIQPAHAKAGETVEVG